MYKRISFVLAILTALSVLISACGGAATTAAPQATAAPKVSELKILWAQWSPADYLQQIGNEYEKATGIKVSVVQEPWATFGDRFFTEMAAKGTSWDMVVGDSQWLGQGATQGLYLDLTDFMTSNGIDKSVTPATLKYYGEYPAGSGKYWGFPTEGDADGWAYRKDLFEDPQEQADFKAQYGYDLKVPETYAQLMDIAKFFTRPDKETYGVAIYTQKGYDAMTMGVENTFFAFGASWQDANNNVKGVVNSPEAVAALQYYKDLYNCCQVPGLSDAFFTETNDAMIGGKAAMIMNYFAFFPALVNEGTNPNYWDKVGFFASPKGPSGQRAAALGGQGMSVISFISPERQAASKEFIKWFAQEDIQQKWADLGGYTCNAKVLAGEKFLKTTPFNPAFAETMTFVKDFWNIPEFGRLLEVSQNELHAFVVGGEGTAQSALDAIAEQHDQILRETGYIK